MARINVEDHKKAIFTLNGIPPFEEEMTFYYDESGNCRKFSLTDAGFNNTDALKGDFVLAGVAHEGRSFDIDVPSFIVTVLLCRYGNFRMMSVAFWRSGLIGSAQFSDIFK